MEGDDESYSPPEIELRFVACHLPLFHQADGLILLVGSGSSKYFTDPEQIFGETRMQQYTRVSTPMEIKAAGDNIMYGTHKVLYWFWTRCGRYLQESQIAGSACYGVEEELFVKHCCNTKRCQNCHH